MRHKWGGLRCTSFLRGYTKYAEEVLMKDLLEYIKNNTCEVSEDGGIVSLNLGGGVYLFYFKWNITYFDICHDDFGVDWNKFYKASVLMYDLGFGWRHVLMSLKIRKFVKEKRRNG